MLYFCYLLIFFFLTPKTAHAITYSVASGSSIQSNCLDKVNPGDTCLVAAGNYSEALILKKTGTTDNPITLKCQQPLSCTINGGASPAIRTSQTTHAYKIDGFRLISQGAYAVNLTIGTPWSDQQSTTSYGNNNYLISNNYLLGGVYIYGHNNTISNNEIQGGDTRYVGIHDEYAASHDNTYSQNTVSHFTRGIWSMNYTNNIIISNNDISYTTHSAINCDGFKHPITNCQILSNHIDHGGEIAIFLENTFNAKIQDNINTCNSDFGILVKNYGIGSDWVSDAEHRQTSTMSTITSNTLCGIKNAILAQGTPGWTLTSNNLSVAPSSTTPILALRDYDSYANNNWTIKSNQFQTSLSPSISITPNTAGLISTQNQFGNNPVFTISSTKLTLSEWQAKGYDISQNTTRTVDLNNDNVIDIKDVQLLTLQFGNPYTIFDFNNIVKQFN